MSYFDLHSMHVASVSRRERIHAALFCAFLGVFMLSSLILAFCSVGPIVLGTEMNANGMVEYMCLGNGCENMNGFRWHDK